MKQEGDPLTLCCPSAHLSIPISPLSTTWSQNEESCAPEQRFMLFILSLLAVGRKVLKFSFLCPGTMQTVCALLTPSPAGPGKAVCSGRAHLEGHGASLVHVGRLQTGGAGRMPAFCRAPCRRGSSMQTPKLLGNKGTAPPGAAARCCVPPMAISCCATRQLLSTGSATALGSSVPGGMVLQSFWFTGSGGSLLLCCWRSEGSPQPAAGRSALEGEANKQQSHSHTSVITAPW